MSKSRTIIIVLSLTTLILGIVLLLWNKSYPEDRTATDDFFVHDIDLEENVIEAEVVRFHDECAHYTCPDGAYCEPCSSILEVKASTGEILRIMPPELEGNFKRFSYLREGKIYKFAIEKIEFQGNLTHYILIATN